jgi:hypothetical protein
MFVGGRWARVPNENIQYQTLTGDTGDTGGGHWCGQADWGMMRSVVRMSIG